jgi:hypothetical protein
LSHFRNVLSMLDFILSEKIIKFVTMNKKKKLKGAEAFGVKVITNKSLDKLSGKVLFPEKLEKANQMLKQIDWVEFRAKYIDKK